MERTGSGAAPAEAGLDLQAMDAPALRKALETQVRGVGGMRADWRMGEGGVGWGVGRCIAAAAARREFVGARGAAWRGEGRGGWRWGARAGGEERDDVQIHKYQVVQQIVNAQDEYIQELQTKNREVLDALKGREAQLRVLRESVQGSAEAGREASRERARAEAAERAVRELQARVEELEEGAPGKAAESSGHTPDVEAVRRAARALGLERDALEARVQDLEQQLGVAQTESASLRSDHSALAAEVDRLRAERAARLDELDRARRAVSEAEGRLHAAQAEAAALRDSTSGALERGRDEIAAESLRWRGVVRDRGDGRGGGWYGVGSGTGWYGVCSRWCVCVCVCVCVCGAGSEFGAGVDGDEDCACGAGRSGERSAGGIGAGGVAYACDDGQGAGRGAARARGVA
jgi:hypothetical protein